MNRPKRPPSESGTLDAIAMPFGMFDYLGGDLTKFSRIIALAQFGGAPQRGEVPRWCLSFLCFYCYLFSLELVYRSESARESKFFAPKGTRAFLCMICQASFCGSHGQKWGKIAPRLANPIVNQKSQITRKRCNIRKKLLWPLTESRGRAFRKHISSGYGNG